MRRYTFFICLIGKATIQLIQQETAEVRLCTSAVGNSDEMPGESESGGNKGARIGLRVAIISFASLIILAPILAILILNIGGFGSANSEAPNVPSEVAPNNPGAEGSMVPSEQKPGDSVGPVYLKHPELTINGSLYRYSGKDIHKDDIGELIIELEIGSDLIKAYRVATNSIAISDNDIEYYIYELVK